MIIIIDWLIVTREGSSQNEPRMWAAFKKSNTY